MRMNLLFLNKKWGKRSVKYNFVKTPSQWKYGFETFTSKLELILDKIFDKNPFLVIALKDFNAKSD